MTPIGRIRFPATVSLASLIAILFLTGTAGAQRRPDPPPTKPGPLLHDVLTAKPIAGALVIPTDLRITKRFRGRLPAYYGEVVSEEQREQVYAIQRQYFLAIELLELYLEKLKDEKSNRIEGVLSQEQRERVEAIRLERKREREKDDKKAERSASNTTN